MTVVHSDPMSAGPQVPTQLSFEAEVIFDATHKIMIKNRHGTAKLDDAIIMRMWIDDSLPVFEYTNHKDFHRRKMQYYESLPDPALE